MRIVDFVDYKKTYHIAIVSSDSFTTDHKAI